MFTRHIPGSAFALVLALTSVGCSQGPDLSPSPGRTDPYPAPYNDPEITVLDADLRPWLGFQPAVIVADETTPMQVSVQCRNMTDKNYAIDYRYTFLDRRGMEVRPVMAWRQQVLQERQLVTLTAGAMNTDAVRYRLEVRWAQQSPGRCVNVGALLDFVAHVGLVILAGYFLSLLSLPALRWRAGPRTITGIAVCAALLLAPWLMTAATPLERAIMAMYTGTYTIKIYDVHRGAALGSIPGLGRFALFLAIPFCHVDRRWDDAPVPTRRESLDRLWRGAAICAAGTACQLAIDFAALGRVAFLLEHAVRVSLVFGTVAGGATVVFALYCLAGGRGLPMFRNFFAARTPADFWRRYNIAVTQFLFEDVFLRAGGVRAPARGTLAAFFVSGVLHEYIASAALFRVQGFQMAFFMVQGVAVAATWRWRPRGALVPLGIALTAAFMLVTSVLFAATAARLFKVYSESAPAWVQPPSGENP